MKNLIVLLALGISTVALSDERLVSGETRKITVGGDSVTVSCISAQLPGCTLKEAGGISCTSGVPKDSNYMVKIDGNRIKTCVTYEEAKQTVRELQALHLCQ